MGQVHTAGGQRIGSDGCLLFVFVCALADGRALVHTTSQFSGHGGHVCCGIARPVLSGDNA